MVSAMRRLRIVSFALACLALLGCRAIGPHGPAGFVPAPATPTAAANAPVVPPLVGGSAMSPATATATATANVAAPTLSPRSATPAPVPDTAFLSSLSFIDAQHGWVVGDVCGGLPQRCTWILWGTVDGGQTWRLIAAPANPAVPAAPGQANSLSTSYSKVLFTTLWDGWLFGSRLFVTHNGGVDWRETPLPGDVESLTVAGGVAWAFSRSNCSQDLPLTGCDHALFISADRGDTWRLGANQPSVRGYELTVLRTDHGSSLLIADEGVRSTDGGQIWQPFTLPDRCWPTTTKVLSQADGTTWLKCSSVAGAGSEGCAVYLSSDWGHSWRLAGVGGTGYSGPIAALSPQHAFMCGRRMSLLETVDGGEAWHEAIVPHEEWFCADLLFIDSIHGWMADRDYAGNLGYEGAIWRTADGGRTWRRVVLP